jgi:hypothetical protein
MVYGPALSRLNQTCSTLETEKRADTVHPNGGRPATWVDLSKGRSMTYPQGPGASTAGRRAAG